MDNKKSWLIFLILSLPLVGAWIWYYQSLPPPVPAKKDDGKNAKLEKKIDGPNKDKEDDTKVKDKDKDKAKEEPKDEPAPFIDEGKLVTVTIGGTDAHHIEAVITSRGAGIQRLTLTKFKAANWLGKPAPDKSAMQLIQDDPYEPSFRVYHFPNGSAEVNPVLGLGEINWTHEKTEHLDDDVDQVVFSTQVPGVEQIKLTKTYRLEPRSYHLVMTLQIQDTRPIAEGGAMRQFRYQLTGGQGLPIEGEWYTGIYRNALIALLDGRSIYRELETCDRISHRSGGDKVPPGNRGGSLVQYAGVANQYFASLIVPDNEQPGGGDPKNLIAWARPTQESSEIKGEFLGFREEKADKDRPEQKVLVFKEFGGKELTYRLLERVETHIASLDLDKHAKAVLSYYEVAYGKDKGVRVATWIRPGSTPRQQFDDITVRVNSEPIDLKPGTTVAHRYLLYHGPVKVRLLAYRSEAEGGIDSELVDRYIDNYHLNTLTDYHSPGWAGKVSQTIFLTDIIITVTRVMHVLLYGLSFVAPSGLCVILLTVIVRGLMFPISRRSALFSLRMQELAPELKKIQEKYKNDPQAKTQAVMEFYRKHKIHPAGMCLPLFLQMPIFMGLYFALQESIQFRLAPFLWIDNLAAPDMLVWWTQSIPYISDPDSMGGVFYLGPYLNLLPIIAVAFMVVQQKMMTPPATDEQQAQQQKMMQWMSLFFGVLFYKMAAGMCIYFISSSLWGLAERKLLPRKKDAPTPGAETSVAPGAPPRGPKRGGRNQPKKPEGNPGALQKIKGWWSEVLKQAQKK